LESIFLQEMTFDGTYDHHSIRLERKFGGEMSISVWVKSEDPTRRHNTIMEMGSRFVSPLPTADYTSFWQDATEAAPLL